MNLDRFLDKDKYPLENIIDDGGFCAIFRTIGCVGDSMSSGELQFKGFDGEEVFKDIYEQSWGQYIARTTGAKVYNFSRGGMTAKEFAEGFGCDIGCFDPECSCQAYVIALGANDLNRIRAGELELGSTDDISKIYFGGNKPTFAGYYAGIIQRLKSQNPGAKFFLVTIPRQNSPEELAKLEDKHAELIYALAERFSDTYVIDLRKYAPVYDKGFKERFFMRNHMNACGYLLTAKMMMSYIDFIVRHNVNDFNNVPLIGTPYWNLTE